MSNEITFSSPVEDYKFIYHESIDILLEMRRLDKSSRLVGVDTDAYYDILQSFKEQRNKLIKNKDRKKELLKIISCVSVDSSHILWGKELFSILENSKDHSGIFAYYEEKHPILDEKIFFVNEKLSKIIDFLYICGFRHSASRYSTKGQDTFCITLMAGDEKINIPSFIFRDWIIIEKEPKFIELLESLDTRNWELLEQLIKAIHNE